jgi:hypothetical protein
MPHVRIKDASGSEFYFDARTTPADIAAVEEMARVLAETVRDTPEFALIRKQ